MRNFVFAVFFTFVLGVSAIAQNIFDVGIVNGKATNLIKPDYPTAAKAVDASGAVNVRVVINEEGKVISANAISGHALLKRASEAAAYKSTFAPTRKEGKPIIVEGILVYNFFSGNDSAKPATIIEDFSKFGEVLNEKAVSLPAPKYPAAAKAVQAGGTLIVEIAVDDLGNVISAKTVSGHPLLRKETEKAAMKAKFQPTMSDGKAFKITGILVYKFIEE